MDTITINISMPKGLYAEAKKKAKRYHYASISELMRNALRWWLSDEDLTVNGFTPEFEAEVLEAGKAADRGDVIEWDGKGSFTDFVLREGEKKWGKHAKSKSHRKVFSRTEKAYKPRSGMERDSGAAAAVV